jgi:uncharacterized protein YjbI with pentapeptide repeats
MNTSNIEIEIKSIFGKVLFTYESKNNTLTKTVEEAIKDDADLSSADLRSANLAYADLRSANLAYANLRSANLRSANLAYADLRSANLASADLSYADLSSADLRSANLRSANLSSANLSSANLAYADLAYADLRSANLRSADLAYADLSSADLSSVRNDFWDVLLRATGEIQTLKESLLEGKVNGSTYSGECACLVGTIANIRGCSYENLGTIKPDSNRPIERFFLGINTGDTPDTNQAAAIAVGWIDEFMTLLCHGK